MCDSRRPLNGADSADYLDANGRAMVITDEGNAVPLRCEYPRPLWLSRAINGGWDSPMPPQAQDAVGGSPEAFSLRLVA